MIKLKQYVIRVICFTPNPIFLKRKAKWSLLPNSTDLPSLLLIIIRNIVSPIGTLQINIGMITLYKFGSFQNTITGIVPTINPINKLPASPIKIFAGLKLYFKNPQQLPANNNEIIPIVIFPAIMDKQPRLKDIIANSAC